MPPPSDIVKVAIEWPGANAQLIEMDQVRAAFTGTAPPHCVTSVTHFSVYLQKRALSSIIREVCDG